MHRDGWWVQTKARPVLSKTQHISASSHIIHNAIAGTLVISDEPTLIYWYLKSVLYSDVLSLSLTLFISLLLFQNASFHLVVTPP